MIDTIADLDLPDPNTKIEEVGEEEYWGQVNKALQDKMDLSLTILAEQLCKSISERAEEVTLDLPNIAPYGDFGAMLEDNDGMANFLKTEAAKPENWKLYRIEMDHKNENLVKFVMKCKAVDDGDVLVGMVFTNKAGVVRHAFCQVDI